MGNGWKLHLAVLAVLLAVCIPLIVIRPRRPRPRTRHTYRGRHR